MYTLGGLMVSSDDDMRPYTLMEHSPESLNPDEVCRGRLHKAGENGYSRKSFDILTSFLDVLVKRAGKVPANFERGELLVDTAMDLETNATKGLARENSLMLQHGPLADNAVVKMAQTFRSGTNDIDALGIHRAVPDAGGDLLLPEEPQGAAAGARQESEALGECPARQPRKRRGEAPTLSRPRRAGAPHASQGLACVGPKRASSCRAS